MKGENELPDTDGGISRQRQGSGRLQAGVQGSLAWVGSIMGLPAGRGKPWLHRVCPGVRGLLTVWTRGLERPWDHCPGGSG